MDPALQIQQRIAQGLTGVSHSLRNSISSLVLGVPNDAAAGGSGSGSGGSAGGPAGTDGSTPASHMDVDLEKGLARLSQSERPGSAGTMKSGAASGTGSNNRRRRSTRNGSTGDLADEGLQDCEGEGEEGDIELHPLPKPKRPPLTLQTLPPEVQMLIIHNLNFGDIERLRRTCRYYHDFATPRMVRALFGVHNLRELLVSHCSSCLAFDDLRTTLLLASSTRRDYPLNAKCVPCAVASRDDRLVVGRKVIMGNGEGIWVCRWCGWPVLPPSAMAHTQFHRDCYRQYNDSLLFFFVLGMLQLALGIVAAALAWRYFRDDVLIFASTVANFILLWLTFFMLMFRGNRVRTYHWTMIMELMILCLWIPPVYSIAPVYRKMPFNEVPKSTTATLAIFSLNMLFRLLNVLGNIVLMFEYQRTNHHLPTKMIPAWRRITNPIMDFLIFWTYPQSVEQKYPPHWS